MQVPAYLAETLFQNREQEPTIYRFRSPCRIEPLVTSTNDRQQLATAARDQVTVVPRAVAAQSPQFRTVNTISRETTGEM